MNEFIEPMWYIERDFLNGKINAETYERVRLEREAFARAREAKIFFQRLAELIYKVKLEPLGW